ncbi:iron-containing alcohol dehydrogenase [Indioceanicola profundi]|uniref:iron-containing alcohol dehydrogenase n=1 Tax=Indioceanicola profundi TaxID=2220096 RepID=UPI000E6AA70C|nr:iron-containing alcohol dehydrogenase [Indioceanicola profundi]
MPLDLSFATTRGLTARPGAARDLAAILRPLDTRHLLVVTDRGVVKAGLLKEPLAALERASIRTTVYDAVVADPPFHVVQAAADAALAAGVDGVLGFGGGSPMDVAKLVAVLAGSPQTLDTMYGMGQVTGPRLPLVLVPTTAGTGSEVTPIAIVTTGESEKKGVVSPVLLPDAAVLDPELLLGLPKPVTAATGIDAMVHAIEAYTSRHKKNPISDALAREALILLARGLPRAWADGSDLEARSDTALGSCLAGIAFANAPVAAVHALAYPVGARFHVPHGVSNSLVLPHVLRFNMEGAAGLYAELAPLIDVKQSGQPLPELMASLARELEVPLRLRDVGIGEEDLPHLARDSMNQTRLLVNNPREVAEADALAIYREAF